MSEMQNSAFLRRGKFGMLFFFFLAAAVSSSGLCFLYVFAYLLATLWLRLTFFCCCPAPASASDDLNVLPVLCFVCVFLVILLSAALPCCC